MKRNYFFDITINRVPVFIEIMASFSFLNSLLTHSEPVLGRVWLSRGYLTFFMVRPVHCSDSEKHDR